MSSQSDPYYKLLGIPPQDQPANHYRLLGIELLENDADVIALASDQRMSFLRTFQVGEWAKQSQQLMNEVAAAKLCLLDAQQKARYDALLTPEALPQARPITRIAILSGLALTILLGGAAVIFSLRGGSDPAKKPQLPTAKQQPKVATKQQQKAATCMEEGKKALASDDFAYAKEMFRAAIQISGDHHEVAQGHLNEIGKRQKFIDGRLANLVSQAEQALATGDRDRAKQLCNRALKMKLATNHYLARALLAKIARLAPPEKPLSKPDPGPREKNWADVAEDVRSSVVQIYTKSEKDWHGSGTGFFVRDDIIVTNHHVIFDRKNKNRAAHQVLVVLHDEASEFAHGYLYQDEATDIAILKVPRNANIKPLHLAAGVKSNVRQGDEVAAFGHPVGLEFSFTPGYVSAIREGQALREDLAGTWIHHSAPISSGNSGGPLLSKRGDVVAMNSWRFMDHEALGGDVQNLNFAISSDDIIKAMRTANKTMTAFEGNQGAETEPSETVNQIQNILKDVLDQ